MKTLRTLALALAALGLAGTASANTIWTLNNVTLVCPNCAPGSTTSTVTGFFEANAGFTALVSWDIDVTGTHLPVNYHYTSTPDNSDVFGFNANTLTLNAAPDFTPYISFDFASPLTNDLPALINLNAGVLGNLAITQATFNCSSSCGQLSTPGTVSSPDPNAVAAVPEPATIGLLSLGLLSMASRLRARRR